MQPFLPFTILLVLGTPIWIMDVFVRDFDFWTPQAFLIHFGSALLGTLVLPQFEKT